MATLDVPASAIGVGRKVVTTAGTRVQLSTVAVKCRSVSITAETDNTGVMTVGGSTVIAALATREGIPLAAGATTTLDINNLSVIYLDTTVSGDGVTYAYTSGG